MCCSDPVNPDFEVSNYSGSLLELSTKSTEGFFTQLVAICEPNCTTLGYNEDTNTITVRNLICVVLL